MAEDGSSSKPSEGGADAAAPPADAAAPPAFVASDADKQRVTNFVTVQSTTAFIFSIIMVLCAPQLLNPPGTVLALNPCQSVPCDPTDLSIYVGGKGPVLYALYFFAWANAFFASTVGLASGLMNISAVVEAENNSEGSGARLLHFFESKPQSWAGRTIRSFLRPKERVLEYRPFVSAMLVMIPLSLPLQLFFAFQMPAVAKYSAISDAYFRVTDRRAAQRARSRAGLTSARTFHFCRSRSSGSTLARSSASTSLRPRSSSGAPTPRASRSSSRSRSASPFSTASRTSSPRCTRGPRRPRVAPRRPPRCVRKFEEAHGNGRRDRRGWRRLLSGHGAAECLTWRDVQG